MIPGVVVTNSNGESLISVLKGNNLIISHIGYETQSITANSDYYVVKLTSAFSNLDEVLIKAKREPPVDVQEKINLFPVSVIDMQRLKNRATNLNEVLSREAGTIIRNTGGLRECQYHLFEGPGREQGGYISGWVAR